MKNAALAIVGLALAAHTAIAQTPDEGRRVLQGLRAVKVIVETIQEANAAGIDTVGLRVEVELELRRVGIMVIDTAAPYVYLNINLIPTTNGVTWAYSYALELNERIVLVRRPATPSVWAATWHKGGVGFAGSNRIVGAIQDVVHSLVMQLVNDYLAANPPSR